MSHDIGTLRAMVASLSATRQATQDLTEAIDAAVATMLEAEFGPPSESDLARFRTWVKDRYCVTVCFAHRPPGLWRAVAFGPYGDAVEHADTPRAAVTQALEALAVTHPTEAAALAAVIPPEAP